MKKPTSQNAFFLLFLIAHEIRTPPLIMAAAVEVSEEVSTTFKENLKTYIIYKIEDEKMIVVEKIGARSGD